MNTEKTQDPVIQNPKRVEIILAAAKIVGFPVDQLGALALDVLDIEPDTTLFPIYNVNPDNEDADPRAFMIFLLHNMIGSDDDHDYISHDLDHATDALEPCPLHGSPCSICCEECLD